MRLRHGTKFKFKSVLHGTLVVRYHVRQHRHLWETLAVKYIHRFALRSKTGAGTHSKFNFEKKKTKQTSLSLVTHPGGNISSDRNHEYCPFEVRAIIFVLFRRDKWVYLFYYDEIYKNTNRLWGEKKKKNRAQYDGETLQ